MIISSIRLILLRMYNGSYNMTIHIQVKTCSNSNCNELNPQPSGNFSVDKGKCDGLSCRCKKCKAQYHQDNKEEIRGKQFQYNQDHKEEKKVQDKNYYQANKKRILARSKRYNETHKEETAAMKKKYQQSTKGKTIAKAAGRKYFQTPAGKAARSGRSHTG